MLIHRQQLKSVKEAYAADPTNSELINLKEELENLIALTKEYLDSQSAPAAPAPAPKKTETPKASGSSTPVDKKRKAPPSSAPAVSAGDEVTAKYRDGKFYPARVISISGSTDNPVYTVIFKGYTSSEVLGLGDVKALSVDKKRAMEISAEDAEREKKKKKYDKKQETRQQKNAEQNEKKASWQKFATKGAKKGRFDFSLLTVSCTDWFVCRQVSPYPVYKGLRNSHHLLRLQAEVRIRFIASISFYNIQLALV